MLITRAPKSLFSDHSFAQLLRDCEGSKLPPVVSWDDWLRAEPQPTLIVIDAHASFNDVAMFFVKEFGGLTLGNGRASIAFLSPDAATLSKPAAMRPELKDSLIANSFFIKMIRSYRWGRLTRFDLLPGLIQRLSFAAEELFTISDTAIRDWNGDLQRFLGHYNEMAGKVSQDIVGKHIPQDPLFPPMNPEQFLKVLASVYLFGRGDQIDVEKLIKEHGPTWLQAKPGVYHLEEQRRKFFDSSTNIRLNDEQMIHLMHGKAVPPPINEQVFRLLRLATKRLKNDVKIKMIEHLRDVAKCLSRGAAAWAERSKIDDNTPIRVLTVKDFVRQKSEHDHIEKAFKDSFSCAFRRGDVVLDCIVGPEQKDNDPLRSWNTYEWWQRAAIDQQEIAVRRMFPENSSASSCLLDYDIIVIEMEYRTRFVGLSIVHWLSMALDELEKTDARQAADGADYRAKHRPQIVALSRNEKAGHSYFCLSHGANSFAHKSRVFSLPSLLTYSRVGREAIPAEPRYSRPNYRVLYGLLPGESSRLRSEHPDEKLLGDNWDRSWFREMPKADLHYHLGTSVTLPTVIALAFNSAGYAVTQSTVTTPMSRAMLFDVCKTVIMANLAFNSFASQGAPFSPHESLWGAARFIRVPKERNGTVARPHLPEKAALEQVVDWLTPRDRPYHQFEVCGVLVAALTIFEDALKEVRDSANLKFCEVLVTEEFHGRVARRQEDSWAYMLAISKLYEGTNGGSLLEPEQDPSLTSFSKGLMAQLSYLMERVSVNWKHAETRSEIDRMRRDAIGLSGSTGKRPAWLGAMHSRVINRVKETVTTLSQAFSHLLVNPEWLEDEYRKFTEAGAAFMTQPNTMNAVVSTFWRHSKSRFPGLAGNAFDCITLENLVTLPDTVHNPDSVPLKDRSLARYLWGAGLLGAEHFQFPENLLLASQDIVSQNVKDNVVYSEVRCGTNGYCRAGLGPQDATDLLCLGFDLSSVYFGWTSPTLRQQLKRTEMQDEPPQRWVRTNILLGAKRHKNPEEFAEIVALTRLYLERGREPRPFWDGSKTSRLILPGSWWDQCAVVGFDLSGDETSEFQGLRESIRPLFVVSAPITIHAGEAATADSIWDAVYSLGAQRIGHGLRLRDNQQLLKFCSRRGICMELCPISNAFTNVFEAVEPGRRGFPSLRDGQDELRSVYPLRAFLDAGIDVCINSDNRSLHKRGTLTDEYLVAAQMIGGMTKWESLKLAKAGFKCAFLSKGELAALLRHVEFEVFQMVAGQDADIDFKNPERVVRRRGSM